MKKINKIKGKKWWAVQGSNLWPLPCQGSDRLNSRTLSVISDDLGHVSFNLGSLAIMGDHGQFIGSCGPWVQLGRGAL